MNSQIITRQIINKLIHDIFDLAKIDTPTDSKEESFNGLIESIQSEINSASAKDKWVSWTRELGYVNTLVSLNKDTIYTINNVATEIGKNIDAIAFNYITTISSKSFDDIYYNADDECVVIPTNGGNSLFITRSALLTAMNGFLATVKEDESTGTDLEKEEKAIVNDIIDNITLVISKDNNELNSNTKYYNMEMAFTDISDIDSLITDTINIVNNQDIESMQGHEAGMQFDLMLYVLETRPACGVKITRRIALLIVKHIHIPTTPIDLSNTEAGIYHAELLNGYTSRLDSEISEDYYNNSPFETLFSKSIIPAP
jgi:hypothetical protein